MDIFKSGKRKHHSLEGDVKVGGINIDLPIVGESSVNVVKEDGERKLLVRAGRKTSSGAVSKPTVSGDARFITPTTVLTASGSVSLFNVPEVIDYEWHLPNGDIFIGSVLETLPIIVFDEPVNYTVYGFDPLGNYSVGTVVSVVRSETTLPVVPFSVTGLPSFVSLNSNGDFNVTVGTDNIGVELQGKILDTTNISLSVDDIIPYNVKLLFSIGEEYQGDASVVIGRFSGALLYDIKVVNLKISDGKPPNLTNLDVSVDTEPALGSTNSFTITGAVGDGITYSIIDSDIALSFNKVNGIVDLESIVMTVTSNDAYLGKIVYFTVRATERDGGFGDVRIGVTIGGEVALRTDTFVFNPPSSSNIKNIIDIPASGMNLVYDDGTVEEVTATFRPIQDITLLDNGLSVTSIDFVLDGILTLRTANTTVGTSVFEVVLFTTDGRISLPIRYSIDMDNLSPIADGITSTLPSTLRIGASGSFVVSGAVDPEDESLRYSLPNLDNSKGITISKDINILDNESVLFNISNNQLHIGDSFNYLVVVNDPLNESDSKVFAYTIRNADGGLSLDIGNARLDFIPSSIGTNSIVPHNLVVSDYVFDDGVVPNIRYRVSVDSGSFTINGGSSVTSGLITASDTLVFRSRGSEGTMTVSLNLVIDGSKISNVVTDTINVTSSAPIIDNLTSTLGNPGIGITGTFRVSGGTDADGHVITYGFEFTSVNKPITFTPPTGNNENTDIGFTVSSHPSYRGLDTSYFVTGTDSTGLTDRKEFPIKIGGNANLLNTINAVYDTEQIENQAFNVFLQSTALAFPNGDVIPTVIRVDNNGTDLLINNSSSLVVPINNNLSLVGATIGTRSFRARIESDDGRVSNYTTFTVNIDSDVSNLAPSDVSVRKTGTGKSLWLDNYENISAVLELDNPAKSLEGWDIKPITFADVAPRITPPLQGLYRLDAMQVSHLDGSFINVNDEIEIKWVLHSDESANNPFIDIKIFNDNTNILIHQIDSDDPSGRVNSNNYILFPAASTNPAFVNAGTLRFELTFTYTSRPSKTIVTKHPVSTASVTRSIRNGYVGTFNVFQITNPDRSFNITELFAYDPNFLREWFSAFIITSNNVGAVPTPVVMGNSVPIPDADGDTEFRIGLNINLPSRWFFYVSINSVEFFEDDVPVSVTGTGVSHELGSGTLASSFGAFIKQELRIRVAAYVGVFNKKRINVTLRDKVGNDINTFFEVTVPALALPSSATIDGNDETALLLGIGSSDTRFFEAFDAPGGSGSWFYTIAESGYADPDPNDPQVYKLRLVPTYPPLNSSIYGDPNVFRIRWHVGYVQPNSYSIFIKQNGVVIHSLSTVGTASGADVNNPGNIDSRLVGTQSNMSVDIVGNYNDGPRTVTNEFTMTNDINDKPVTNRVRIPIVVFERDRPSNSFIENGNLLRYSDDHDRSLQTFTLSAYGVNGISGVTNELIFRSTLPTPITHLTSIILDGFTGSNLPNGTLYKLNRVQRRPNGGASNIDTTDVSILRTDGVGGVVALNEYMPLGTPVRIGVGNSLISTTDSWVFTFIFYTYTSSRAGTIHFFNNN